MSSVHSNHYIGTQSSSNSNGLSLTTGNAMEHILMYLLYMIQQRMLIK